MSTTRDVFCQTLVNIDFTKFSNESCARAIAVIISYEISAGSVVLTRHRLALIDIYLAVSTAVTVFTIANWSSNVCQADAFVFARLGYAISIIAKRSLETIATNTCEVVASS